MTVLETPRAKYILAHFSQKIAEREIGRAVIDPTWFAVCGESVVRERVQTMFYADPTPHKSYVLWIARQWINGEIKQANDFSKIGLWLAEFEKIKASGFFKRTPSAGSADINRFTVTTLADFLEGLRPDQKTSNNEKERLQEEKFYKTRAAVRYIDDETTLIVRVNTHAASCFFGKNTRWCTAARDDSDTFKEYKVSGALIIVLDKPTNRRWQMFVPKYEREVEFLNERDEAVTDMATICCETFTKFAKWTFAEKQFFHADFPNELYLAALDYSDPDDLARAISSFGLKDRDFIKEKLTNIKKVNEGLFDVLVHRGFVSCISPDRPMPKKYKTALAELVACEEETRRRRELMAKQRRNDVYGDPIYDIHSPANYITIRQILVGR